MKLDLNLEDKYNKMIGTPIHKLVTVLALPGIIGMVISSIYNIVDTYYVSKINTSATGAVGISFVLMSVVQAIGFTIGHGSGNYISRLLGRKDINRAHKIAATGFYTAITLSFVLSVFGFIFLDKLVYLLGSTETIAPYAKSYIKYLLVGMPFMSASLVMNVILRFQGSAYFGMIGIGIGGILNIVLDPILIFKYKMGISGAAIATIISQFVSFCILYYNCSISGNIKIRLRNFTLEWKVHRRIISGGLPSFARQIFESISIIILNKVAGPFGDYVIASMAIVMRLSQFATSLIYGFSQGYQPVCGFNYGAKRYDRVIMAFWFCFKVCLLICILFSIVGFVFSAQIIALFQKGDILLVIIGSKALKFQSIVFPLFAWFALVNTTLQIIGKTLQALILSIVQQGLFFIPLIFLLSSLWNITGVQLSQPIADVCSFLLAVYMGNSLIGEFKLLQKKEF